MVTLLRGVANSPEQEVSVKPSGRAVVGLGFVGTWGGWEVDCPAADWEGAAGGPAMERGASLAGVEEAEGDLWEDGDEEWPAEDWEYTTGSSAVCTLRWSATRFTMELKKLKSHGWLFPRGSLLFGWDPAVLEREKGGGDIVVGYEEAEAVCDEALYS